MSFTWHLVVVRGVYAKLYFGCLLITIGWFEARYLGICSNQSCLPDYKIIDFGSYWSLVALTNFIDILGWVAHGFHFRPSPHRKEDSGCGCGRLTFIICPFGGFATQFIATKVVSTFVAKIGRLYGISKSITSDHNQIFVSQFWRQLYLLSGTESTLTPCPTLRWAVRLR